MSACVCEWNGVRMTEWNFLGGRLSAISEAQDYVALATQRRAQSSVVLEIQGTVAQGGRGCPVWLPVVRAEPERDTGGDLYSGCGAVAA